MQLIMIGVAVTALAVTTSISTPCCSSSKGRVPSIAAWLGQFEFGLLSSCCFQPTKPSEHALSETFLPRTSTSAVPQQPGSQPGRQIDAVSHSETRTVSHLAGSQPDR